LRSAASALRHALLAAALAVPAAVWAQAVAPAGPPTRAQVQAAVERVSHDPDLPQKVKETKLRLKPRTPEPAKPGEGDFKWLREFVRWLTEAGRLLVWLAGAAAVAAVLVSLRRWARARAAAAAFQANALPSHVQSLDIRPESLPAQIGEAAAALWQRGDYRAALSLLYRGALSRLVHEHGVPIRAASTEGECVTLAGRRLEPASGEFFARLVQAWQVAVYGARLPAAEQALALCRDFDTCLPARPRPEPAA
jgi:hypothetical protein